MAEQAKELSEHWRRSKRCRRITIGKFLMQKGLLLAQRSCVDLYPPVLHQCGILSEYYKITVLDLPARKNARKCLTASDVHRIQIEMPAESKYLPGLARMKCLGSYAKTFKGLLKANPATAIAFDPDAAVLLLRYKKEFPELPCIVHLHEILADRWLKTTLRDRLTCRYLQCILNQADLVVMADDYRARLTKMFSGLKGPLQVVMNCPRRIANIPVSKLRPFLLEHGIAAERIVHFQGAVARSANVDRMILSMKHWPRDAVFVIVGEGKAEYIEKLKRIAGETGVLDRVVFTGRISYDQIMEFAVGATVGLTTLNTMALNYRWSAGASNKRFEYLALGIPQVTNIGSGIDRIFGRRGVAAMADPKDPESIGFHINQYLINPELCQKASRRARELHLQEYNYEHQFAPVLNWIQEQTGRNE